MHLFLFLALGRSGWGETILGVELARDLVRLGEEVRFMAHVSMAPIVAGGPWECEFVGDEPGPWLSTLLSAHIARHRAESVVLVDFAVATRSLERLGVHVAAVHLEYEQHVESLKCDSAVHVEVHVEVDPEPGGPTLRVVNVVGGCPA